MKFLSLFLLITSLSIISISTLKAQTYDEHYTVDYINSQLEKKCHVFTEKKKYKS